MIFMTVSEKKIIRPFQFLFLYIGIRKNICIHNSTVYDIEAAAVSIFYQKAASPVFSVSAFTDNFSHIHITAFDRFSDIPFFRSPEIPNIKDIPLPPPVSLPSHGRFRPQKWT